MEEIALYQLRDKDFDQVKTVEEASSCYACFTTMTVLAETKKAFGGTSRFPITSSAKPDKWLAKSVIVKIGKTSAGNIAYKIPMFVNVC